MENHIPTIYPARIHEDEKWKLLIMGLYELVKDGTYDNPKLAESWPIKGRQWEWCLKAVEQTFRYLPDDVKAWVQPLYNECMDTLEAKPKIDHPYYDMYPYLLEPGNFNHKKTKY